MSSLCVHRRLPKFKLGSRPRAQVEPAAAKPTGDGDELRELAVTFRQTVHRLSSLVRELEEAHQETLRAEAEKKQFYRDVICAVTHGKFELVEQEQIPREGRLVVDLPVTNGPEFKAARNAIQESAEAAGLSEDRTTDLILAAAEALGNVLKHAADGRCQVRQTAEAVVVRISDRGTGIASHFLPAAILKPGFSTKVSLGMGYKMMLELVDRVWLGTSETGTIVQLEQRLVPTSPADDSPLAEAMKRL